MYVDNTKPHTLVTAVDNWDEHEGTRAHRQMTRTHTQTHQDLCARLERVRGLHSCSISSGVTWNFSSSPKVGFTPSCSWRAGGGGEDARVDSPILHAESTLQPTHTPPPAPSHHKRTCNHNSTHGIHSTLSVHVANPHLQSDYSPSLLTHPYPTITPPSLTLTPSLPPSPSPSTPHPHSSLTPTPHPHPSLTPTPHPHPSLTPTPHPSLTPTPHPHPSLTPTPHPHPSLTPTYHCHHGKALVEEPILVLVPFKDPEPALRPHFSPNGLDLLTVKVLLRRTLTGFAVIILEWLGRGEGRGGQGEGGKGRGGIQLHFA